MAEIPEIPFTVLALTPPYQPYWSLAGERKVLVEGTGSGHHGHTLPMPSHSMIFQLQLVAQEKELVTLNSLAAVPYRTTGEAHLLSRMMCLLE
jgi:hypothetical protein